MLIITLQKTRKHQNKSQTLTSCSHELDEKVRSTPEDLWHHLLVEQHKHKHCMLA